VILQRGGGSGRRGDADEIPGSIADMARMLRRARTRQGLRFEDVSLRTGLPVGQMEALEAGSINRIPDRVVVLKTLRRYADSLGLPGDRYVLALVECWPNPSATSPAGGGGEDPVRAAGVGVAAGAAVSRTTRPSRANAGAGAGTAVSRSSSAVAAGSAAGGAKHIGGTSGSARGSSGRTGGTLVDDAEPMVDTGTTPAVRPATVPKERGPLLLRVTLIVLGIAVVVGLAGLVIHIFEPSWLDTLGITHGKKSPATHAQTTSTPAAPPVFAVASTTPTGATFHVHSPTFLVRVLPTGTASWMQATDIQHVSPVFAGVVGAGQEKDFLVNQSLTLEVGSSSAHVFVSVGSKTVGFYFPPAAPFTMTFSST